jgi:hypothetical protein
LLDDLRAHGVPNKFERTALARFSGSNRVQLLSALRFLGLLERDEATRPLHALVAAKDQKAQSDQLRIILDGAYAPIMALNLQSTTPGELADAFRKHYKMQDSVLPKCISFFLNTAKEAKVNLSPRVLQRARPGSGIRRRSPRNGNPPADSAPATTTPDSGQRTPRAATAKGPTGVVLPQLPPFDPKWDAETQRLWMRNYDRLAGLMSGDK